jgi:hypothetical protein
VVGPVSDSRVTGHRRSNFGRDFECIREDGFDWTNLAGYTEDW